MWPVVNSKLDWVTMLIVPIEANLVFPATKVIFQEVYVGVGDGMQAVCLVRNLHSLAAGMDSKCLAGN